MLHDFFAWNHELSLEILERIFNLLQYIADPSCAEAGALATKTAPIISGRPKEGREYLSNSLSWLSRSRD